MLLALRKPTAGKIEMFGSDPYHAIKSGQVGAMLQSGGLMPEVTVRELVTLIAGLHPRPVPVNTTLRRAATIFRRAAHRSRTSMAERRPSLTRLKHMLVRKIAAPGTAQTEGCT